MKTRARSCWPWLLLFLVLLSCLPVAVLGGPPMPPNTPKPTRFPSPTPCCPTLTPVPPPFTPYPPNPHPTRWPSPTPTPTIPVIYPPWARRYFPLVIK